jgi:opacity protein-like surface antigen
MPMNAKLISIMGGIAVAAMVPGAANAGGDYYGGAITGAAIPAPIPVPVYESVWYMRVDSGVGLGDVAGASENGMVFGEEIDGSPYSADPTFGTSKSWLEARHDHDLLIGGGIGYRFNERFRMDGTIDYLRGSRIIIEGSHNADLLSSGAPTAGSFEGYVRDITDTQGAAFLINAYVDMGNWRSFTPYIGGGIGIATTTIERSIGFKQIAHDSSSGTTVDSSHSKGYVTVADSTEQSLAAMATAGVTYKMSDRMDLDLNYRYLFVDGVSSTAEVNGHTSTITIDDTHDHQLRAGLRFNVN